jgi:hypothetical protein
VVSESCALKQQNFEGAARKAENSKDQENERTATQKPRPTSLETQERQRQAGGNDDTDDCAQHGIPSCTYV